LLATSPTQPTVVIKSARIKVFMGGQDITNCERSPQGASAPCRLFSQKRVSVAPRAACVRRVTPWLRKFLPVDHVGVVGAPLAKDLARSVES
jgi:hypothetical protein